MKIGLAVAVLGALGFLMLGRGDTDGTSARRLVERGALLVDVRTPEEFASGHIPGAVNIPVQALGGRMGELGAKDQSLVLYCRSGARSGHAATMLREAGFTAVHDLGPMSAW